MGLKPDSRTIIHLGINFLFTPNVNLTPQASLAFQQAVILEGLEYQKTSIEADKFVLIRSFPTPLKITVGTIQPPQISQFLIVAEDPGRPLEMFINEAEAAQRAFLNTWTQPAYQIVSCDITIRELHETSEEHAFKDLWESRLNQTRDSLNVFGRPLLGGGLRLVFAPLDNEDRPAQIEVKIESYLRNPRKLFIETQFLHPQPTLPCPPDQDPFKIRDKLTEVDNFVTKKVIAFITGEN